MRKDGWVLLGIAFGAAALGWFVGRGPPPVAPDVEALESENARLQEEVRELRRAASLKAPLLPSGDRPGAGPAAPSLEGRPAPTSPSRPGGSGGPNAAEEERLVELWIRALRTAVAAQDGGKIERYRLALVAMGAPAVPALVRLAQDGQEAAAVRVQALLALSDLRVPEGRVAAWSILEDADEPPELVQHALNLAQAVGGGLPTRVQEMASDRSTPVPVRALALRALVVADPEASMPLVRRMLAEGGDERRLAIGALAAAQHRSFLPVLLDTLESEDPPEDTQSLIGAIARLKGQPWSAAQMTGPPDTPMAGDLGTAWASKTGDMGEVWVELDYPQAVRPGGVRIHETFNPGAVARVLGKGADGAWITLWEGVAPTDAAPTWFEPRLAPVSDRISTIRLVLDTNRVAGWNEIDAVEWIGDGLRQWASDARASSSYPDS
jgi:hypothetical protein